MTPTLFARLFRASRFRLAHWRIGCRARLRRPSYLKHHAACGLSVGLGSSVAKNASCLMLLAYPTAPDCNGGWRSSGWAARDAVVRSTSSLTPPEAPPQNRGLSADPTPTGSRHLGGRGAALMSQRSAAERAAGSRGAFRSGLRPKDSSADWKVSHSGKPARFSKSLVPGAVGQSEP